VISHSVGPPAVLRAASAFALASGFSALVYEVLWLKELGLLFGNTAHASAVGLAVFFTGLAAGSWFWGARLSTHHSPLALYAWLEIGIAVSAAPFFWLMDAYRGLYAPLFEFVGSSPALFTSVKAACVP